MTPIFQILADNQDITSKIADRLLSLTIVDEAGIRSDTAQITLDDRDNAIELPRTGAELVVSISYKETKLVKTGLYIVDEVSISSPPHSMSIRAKAANMPKAIKAPKTRPWDNVTIGDLVKTIAEEHGLTAKVGEDLASVAIVHMDQTQESDLNLLTRMAKQYDAISKPVGGMLLFVKRAMGKSVSGKTLPETTIKPADITSWDVTLTERGKYGAVQAEWHNNATAIREKVQAGDGEPVFPLRRSYPDKAQAQAAVDAKLAIFNRGTGGLEITMPGNPALMAEGIINLEGFRSGVDGRWLLNSVTHTIGAQGFITSISGEGAK
ncbi:MAG: hypothetical protein HQL68_02215 [Magnetococcales bacterium]|nr:hypothetical protein [Magnetococcales bacterium]